MAYTFPGFTRGLLSPIPTGGDLDPGEGRVPGLLDGDAARQFAAAQGLGAFGAQMMAAGAPTTDPGGAARGMAQAGTAYGDAYAQALEGIQRQQLYDMEVQGILEDRQREADADAWWQQNGGGLLGPGQENLGGLLGTMDPTRRSELAFDYATRPANTDLVQTYDPTTGQMVWTPKGGASGMPSAAPDPFTPDVQNVYQGDTMQSGYFDQNGQWVAMGSGPRWQGDTGAPETRTINRGTETVTQEWDGTAWRDVSTGPRWQDPAGGQPEWGNFVSATNPDDVRTVNLNDPAAVAELTAAGYVKAGNASLGGGGPSLQQEADNQRVLAARAYLDSLGLSRDDLVSKTRKGDEIWGENPNYDPFLAKIVETASSPLVGVDDPDYADTFAGAYGGYGNTNTDEFGFSGLGSPAPGDVNGDSLASDMPRLPNGQVDADGLVPGAYYRDTLGGTYQWDGQQFLSVSVGRD